MKKIVEKIDKLLKKQYYVIDVLPKQVPNNSKGQFFEVEEYLLNNHRQLCLHYRFASVILKLMCYYPVILFIVNHNKIVKDPSPKMIGDSIYHMMENHGETLNILFSKNVLFVLEESCLTITVYNPSKDMRAIIEKIAKGEGLFWWKPEQS